MSGLLSEGEASHLQPLLAKLGQLANASSSTPKEGEDEPAAAEAKASDGSAQSIEPFARPLLDAVEHTTVQLLLAVQNLRQQSLQPPNTAAAESAVKEEDDEEDGGGTEEGSVLKHHEWLCKLLSAARGDQITSSLTSVIQSLLTLADGPTSPALREMAAKVVSELVPAVSLHLSSLRWAVHQSMSFHGSLVRLELVLLNLFSELFAKGFCTAGKEEEGGEGGKGGQMTDDVEGTGMGEGEGKKDVSEELQEEGQIEGNSGDKKDEGMDGEDKMDEGGGKDERAKEDEGVEMTNEFDGDMKDLEQPDKNKEDDEEDEDGKDEPEHGMGDLDEENQDVVDERLWDKEEDDHLKPQGDEKVEEDAEVQPQGDVQMEAKEEEGEKPKKKQKKEEEKKGKEEEEQADPTKPPEEEEGEDGEGDEEGQVKPEVEKEENHYKKPQAEPGGDGDEDEEEKGNDDEAMPDELPNGMDENDEGEGEGEVAEGDGDEDEDAPADNADAPDAQPPPEDGQEEEEGDGEAAVKEEADAEDAEAKEEPAAGGTAQGDEEEDDEGEGEVDEEDAAELAERAQKSYENQMTFEDGKAASAPTSQQRSDQDAPQEDQQSAAPPPEQSAESAEGAKQSSTRATGGDGEGDEYMPMPQNSSNEQASNKPPPPPPKRRPNAPNPYHALGDALAFWHKQLQMVEREAMEDEDGQGADEEAQAPPKDGGGGGEEQPPPSGEFERTKEGEGADTQVLADATQEQFEAMELAKKQGQEEKAEKEKKGVNSGGGKEEEEEGAPQPMVTEEEEAAKAAEKEKEEERKGEASEAPKRSKAEELMSGGPSKKSKKSEEKKEDEMASENVEGREEDVEEDVEDGVSLVQKGRSREEQENGDGLSGGGQIGAPRQHGGVEEGDLPEAEEEVGSAERQDPEEEAAEAEEAAADLALMESDLEARLAEWQQHQGGDGGLAEDAWRALESRTASLSQELSEQLRLILEATVASKLQGDYRTGKRIAMRKVIPYIASGFRKDKIWLRRTKPSKRQYQIMLCIDDSESMRDTGAGGLACEALALICQALTTVEAGQLAVVSFAEQVELLHPFEKPFTAESGAHMLTRFTFQNKRTHMEGLLKSVVSTLRLARQQHGRGEEMQLVIIVSDGRKSPSWGDPSSYIRLAQQEHILLCFVIIDAQESRDSILNLQSTSWANGKLSMSRWIDSFPFPYYLVLRELSALPQILADALRQWFEILKD